VRTKEGNKVLLVLGQKTGVFIVRTKEGNKVLLVLGQKTGENFVLLFSPHDEHNSLLTQDQ
jgi:hypothetical protein